STLVNMLSGELAPSVGSVLFDGLDVTRWPQPRRARAGLGRSYQRTTIFGEFSVLENCRLAAQAQAPRPWPFWERAAHDAPSLAAAARALAAAGLSDVAGRTAGTLSHGAKRQLEIAMCLATSPRALLLDEPLAGMGAEETGRMLALLATLKPGHAILLVEHDMDAVFRVADRITVMVDGRVIASDTPERIRDDAGVRDAYLGDSLV
ncbi:MAG: ABC transporter ATP-binding protein, partial [Caldimonas sp.]